jgi:hypothetical protein
MYPSHDDQRGMLEALYCVAESIECSIRSVTLVIKERYVAMASLAIASLKVVDRDA